MAPKWRRTVFLRNPIAMGSDSHLLLQSRSKFLLVNAERREFLPHSRRSVNYDNCRILSATIARSRFRDNFLRGCLGFSVSTDSGLSYWKRRCWVAHQARRHGFTISAMSTSRDSDDGAQRPGGTHTEAAVYPCLYLKGAVSTGKTIQYPGTVVVLGDVEEGGTIVADGDVIVLGRLLGDVHGGQNGNKSAVVYATQLDARLVRIAESTALVSTSQFSGSPVIASVHEDGTLGVMDYKGYGLGHGKAGQVMKNNRSIRAAAQTFNDNKKASDSSVLYCTAQKEPLEASKGSESTDQTSTKRPAQLAFFTGVYISIVGVALLVFPTPLFGALFDVRSVTVGWIRVGAILAVVFGVYYIGTAIGDMRGSSGARAFYMSTVVGRVFLFLGFCWLVAAGAAQRALLLVGIVNMLGAMSMLFALLQDSKAKVINA